MSLLALGSLALTGLGAAGSLMGNSSGGSFKPLGYGTERGAINPMMWGQLQEALKGKPTPEDWNWYTSMMGNIGQNYTNALNATKANFAGRGIYDSGWMNQRSNAFASDRASQESAALAQIYQNAIARQLEAQNLTGQYLAGARAGSGTYKY